MITQDTAAKLWHCYREIVASEKLLADMKETADKWPNDPHAPTLKDAFGRARHLQLGVPSGQSSHQIFNVAPALAESVIRAHIANQRAELVAANEQARMEIGT